MKRKRTLFNFLSDFTPQLFIAILGIFKIKIFLNNWGEDTLGLYQLYSQFFSYLAMVEIGISSGILYTLYKPTASNNYEELKKIYNGAHYAFKMIGMIIIGLGLILSLFISFFIKNNTFDFLFLQFTFLLYVLANVLNYFFMAQKLLFYAKEKNYVPNLIYQISTILKSLLEILLVFLHFEFVHVLILGIVMGIVSNLVLEFYYRREFSNLPKIKEKKFSFSSNLKPIILQKFSNLVSNNIDILLISKFIGLGQVVVYTTYQYITLSLQLLTDKISNSLLTSVGNVLAIDKKEVDRLFLKVNDTLYISALLICLPLYFVLNSFIDLWYKGEIITSSLLAFLFVGLLFFNIIKQNSNLFVNASGLFQETKICSVVELVLNFVLSILFVFWFQTPGVLFATLISLFFSEFILKNAIVLKRLCHQNFFYYIRISAHYFFILCINALILSFLFNPIFVSTIFRWFFVGICIFGLNFLLTILQVYLWNHFLKKRANSC